MQLTGRWFSSVQDGIYTPRKAHMRSTPSLRSFPNVAFETIPTIRLTDDGPLSSFQRRSSSASSFHASLEDQAIAGVVSLEWTVKIQELSNCIEPVTVSWSPAGTDSTQHCVLTFVTYSIVVFFSVYIISFILKYLSARPSPSPPPFFFIKLILAS